MISSIRNNLLWSAGRPVAIALAVMALLAFIFYQPLIYGVGVLFLFSLYFFRNPERVCQAAHNDNTILICPADGKVVALEQSPIEGYATKISIFLSPLDVHVNWSPIQGIIKEVTHKPGLFIPAYVPKSSELNERNDLLIADQHNRSLLVRQIAGTVARRICCWVFAGDSIAQGEKYGMIRFGSRIDIFVPKNVIINVALGERVWGGRTVLGRWEA